MGTCIGHQQCPQCHSEGKDNSGDNLAIYDDNSKYCFSCGYSEKGESNLGVKEKKLISSEKELEKLLSKKLSKEEIDNIVKETSSDPKGWRGLHDRYLKGLGIRFKHDENGNPCEMLTPTTTTLNGKTEFVGFKSRKFPKDFSSPKGYVGNLSDLIGYHKFKNSKRTLIIVEGECFTKDTQVLTSRGWINFGSITDDDVVAQVNDDMTASFVKPLSFIEKSYDGKLVLNKTAKTESLTTENHNMVYINHKGDVVKKLAKENVSTLFKIPTSVQLDGSSINLNNDQISLILAICADSKIDIRDNGDKYLHFAFIKERKIKRLREVLTRLNITFTSYTNTYKSGKTYTTFNFTAPSWVSGKEIPKEWVDASLSQKEFILDELLNWDGNTAHTNRENFICEFSSKHYSECATVQAIASSTGRYSRIKKRENSLGVWYCVSYHKEGRNTLASTQKINKTFIDYKGMVYCVTVPSGMILTRYNNKVSVCGNCDFASAYQMYQMDMESKGKKYETPAVVSVVNGISSIVKVFKENDNNFKFYRQFERVVIAVDNDEVSNKIVEDFVENMPRETLYRATLRYKDANEYLTRGATNEWVNDTYWNPTPCSVASIAGSNDWLSDAKEELTTPRLLLPPFMQGVNSATRGGLPMGRYVIFAGASSIGKTVFVNSMIYDWIIQDTHRIGVVSLELSRGQYYVEMLSRHIGVNIDDIDDNTERAVLLDDVDIVDRGNELFMREDGTSRFHVVDDRDGSIAKIQELCEELVLKHNIDVLILDPISDLTQRLDNQQQVVFNSWIKSFIKKHNVLVVGISHVKKGDKNYDNGDIPDEGDLIGSYSGASSAAAIFFLSRNKMSNDLVERNTTLVTTPKIRWTGRTGTVDRVFFDHTTRRLINYKDYMSGDYVRTTEVIEPKKEVVDF